LPRLAIVAVFAIVFLGAGSLSAIARQTRSTPPRAQRAATPGEETPPAADLAEADVAVRVVPGAAGRAVPAAWARAIPGAPAPQGSGSPSLQAAPRPSGQASAAAPGRASPRSLKRAFRRAKLEQLTAQRGQGPAAGAAAATDPGGPSGPGERHDEESQ
jgi:hypothetical protein